MHAGNYPLRIERCDDLFFKLAVPSDTLQKSYKKKKLSNKIFTQHEKYLHFYRYHNPRFQSWMLMVISESTIFYMSPQYLFPVCLFTFYTEFNLPFYCPVLQSWKILHLFISLHLSWWNFVSSPPLILFLSSENMMIATTCNRQPCKTLTFLLAFIPIFYWLFIHDNLSYPLPAFVKSPLKFK